MATKTNYKQIAMHAGITAIVVALVNKLMTPQKGLGVALKVLAFMPIEHQAKFADVVTIENARNSSWLVEQMANLDTEDPNTYKAINNTSIGNSAYIALYGTNELARKKSLRILENIKSIVV